MRRVAVGLVLGWGLVASGAWGQSGVGGPSRPSAAPPRADLICEVDGPVTILKLLPAGQVVKKGDVVCELDSAGLKDQLVNQEISIKRAEQSLSRAKTNWQIADLAARAYSNAEYPMEVQRLEARIRLAEGEIRLAERELSAPGKAAAGDSSVPSREGLDRMRRDFELREARTALRVLEGFTRERRVRELEVALSSAREEQLTAEAALGLEKARAEKLRKQIEACVIKAPRDGVFRVGPSFNIREEGTVRARQLLGWILAPEAEPREAKPDAPKPAP